MALITSDCALTSALIFLSTWRGSQLFCLFKKQTKWFGVDRSERRLTKTENALSELRAQYEGEVGSLKDTLTGLEGRVGMSEGVGPSPSPMNCHLMATPCTFIRCFNRDNTGGAIKMTVSPTAIGPSPSPMDCHHARPLTVAGVSTMWLFNKEKGRPQILKQ